MPEPGAFVPVGDAYLRQQLMTEQRNSISGTLTKMSNGSPVKIVAFGDSMTAGVFPPGGGLPLPYPEELQAVLRDAYRNNSITVVNMGEGGRQTSKALMDFQDEVIDETPDMVIIMFGINDARNIPLVTNIDEYKSNIEQMINLAKNSGIEALVLSPTPTLESDLDKNRRLAVYNQGCIETAKKNNVPYVDMHKFINGLYSSGSVQPSFLVWDSIHFNDYSQIAAAIADVICVSGFQMVSGETKINSYRSNLVSTNLLVTDTVITTDKMHGYYMLSSDMIAGKYIRFDFFVSRIGLDIVLDTFKYPMGGIIEASVDGQPVEINAFNLDRLVVGTGVTLIKNATIGFHSIEFKSDDLSIGDSAGARGEFYVGALMSINRQSVGDDYKFSGDASQEFGSSQVFVNAINGEYRYTSVDSGENGAIITGGKSIEVVSGRKIIIEASVRFSASGSGFTWLGSELINKQLYSGANSGYGIFAAADAVYLFAFGSGNAYSTLATSATTLDPSAYHDVVIEILSDGTHTVSINGSEVFSGIATSASGASGYFGVFSGATAGTTYVKNVMYAYV